MSESHLFHAPTGAGRKAVVATLVLLLHGAALWALQAGLHRQAPPAPEPLIVPAELLSQAATLPAPPAPQSTPVPQPTTTPPVRPTPQKPRPTPQPQSAPKAQPTLATPAPSERAAAQASTEPAPEAPSTVPSTTPAAPAATALAPAAPPRIELPSSNAAYLNNPKPPYPAISKRMGEQGKVVLRVLISAEGLPQKVEISQSSGYDRLDRQAQEAVQHWRFVPGKRNGVPEAMWTLVPIQFVLE